MIFDSIAKSTTAVDKFETAHMFVTFVHIFLGSLVPKIYILLP